VLAVEIAPVVVLIGLTLLLTIKAEAALGFFNDAARAVARPQAYVEGVFAAPRVVDQEDVQ
jgi:multicomponent K+:H+ antiporter subunit D